MQTTPIAQLLLNAAPATDGLHSSPTPQALHQWLNTKPNFKHLAWLLEFAIEEYHTLHQKHGTNMEIARFIYHLIETESTDECDPALYLDDIILVITLCYHQSNDHMAKHFAYMYQSLCNLYTKIKTLKTLNTMQTQHLTQDQFLQAIAPYLQYKPDSANYALYTIFSKLLIVEGGDDQFAQFKHHAVAFEFSKFVELHHIEDYHNNPSDEEYAYIDTYTDIKKSYGHTITSNLLKP